MRTINSLLREVNANQYQIRQDICQNTCENILPFLDSAKEYLLASDLNKNTWSALSEEDKEALYLFVLMNELFHFKSSPRNFLVNASFYFPKETTLHSRLKMFAKLSKMNHIQNQYELLVMGFLNDANNVYNMEDPYLEKESVRQLLLNYFITFIETSRNCLLNLGQVGMVESILPSMVTKFAGNQFAMDSIPSIIGILKGTFDRSSIKIAFCAPAI